jgi:hypothetical protein
MTDIVTTTVKAVDPADVLDTALSAVIGAADRQALVAGILQSAARLAGESVDDLQTLAKTADKVVGGGALSALLPIAQQIDPREHVVTEAQAIWQMEWRQRNPDGTRKYPDKPEVEEVFEEAPALALLLINEVVHLNSHHWMDSWPKDARATIYMGVDCSDVFAWGCSDSEDATHADIESVYRHWLKDPTWGGAVWSMIKRRQMPQRPVEKRIRDAGIWDLDALQAEHGLLPNHYDGISGVQAGQKYEAYCAWERGEGREPLPYDAKWWEGWRRFVAARPDWHDAAWKAEEERRRLEWRTGNGYETPADDADPQTLDVAAEVARLANMVEAAAERRGKAKTAADDSARSYFVQSAAASEREILAALPTLLGAIGGGDAK